MRFNRLDLNLLVALDHMLELKSISRAAEKMNMSQSAMSNALTRLRDYFDDQLLVQIGRKMELSPRAAAMQHAIRDILVRVEATVTADVAFDAANSNREFRVLASDYSVSVLVPKVLELAANQGSDVRFSIIPQLEYPYLAIERGSADVLVTPSVFTSKNHPSELLFEDPFVCVAWSGGRYAKGPLTKEQYSTAGHVRMMPPTLGRSFETQFLEEAGIERRIEVNTYGFAQLPQLVVGTDRLATVHRLLALKAMNSLPIVCHDLPFSSQNLDQNIQWHEHRSSDPGIIWLRSIFHEAARQLDMP